MAFVFYDTETTGTDTAFDQILQFAAIRTDPQLNEIDRFDIRCRLLPHIVPAPGAMSVTKIAAARLFDASLGSHYDMACGIRTKLLTWSPALFIGYNSLSFDEHLLRQAFYKNLHPPYLTNTNGNSRSDILRMVRAASLFAPDALKLPVSDDGQLVFKLDRIAPLNGFTGGPAHDAVNDVEAAIFLCRVLMTRAPDLWSAFMRFSQKATVVDYVMAEPLFCLSDFYFGTSYSWIVTAIGPNPDNNSEHYVYDLAIEPESLVNLTEAELIDRLGIPAKPVRRLRSNACPIIMPVEDAPSIASAAQLGIEELTRRAEFLRDRDDLRQRLIGAFEAQREERPPSPHFERQLYDGFFPREDEALMEHFHTLPWEERPAIINTFSDRRLKQIGRRLLYLERPDLLADATRAEFDRAVAHRISADDAERPWLTLPKAIAAIDELLTNADPAEVAFLHDHRAHLTERLAIEALHREEYKARDIALAGAFVTLAGDGSVRIERGFIRTEDEPKFKAKATDHKTERSAKDADGLAPLSEKLIAELTAYRTSALRNELAQHPATALIALVHALALATFFEANNGSCLEITPKSAWLSGHAHGIEESFAEKQIADRHTAWAKRLPEEAEALWRFLHGLSDAERLELLAHCVSLTANAIRAPRQRSGESEAHAAILAHDVALDMTAYWQPTAASYFGRVSKERIIQALREGVSPQAAENIARLKKQAMAEAAETALAGKGWLPSLLRHTP
jgi:exodeoxyribonuclease-1